MQDFERTPQPHDVRMQGSVRVEFALERANRTGLLSKPFPLAFHPGSQIWAHAPLGDAGVLLWVEETWQVPQPDIKSHRGLLSPGPPGVETQVVS